MLETAPTLPEGFSWQFIDADGQDITTTPIYAVSDAVEARLWCENGDLIAEAHRVPAESDAWYSQVEPGATRRFGSLDVLVGRAKALKLLES
jgi:hypothetical protein